MHGTGYPMDPNHDDRNLDVDSVRPLEHWLPDKSLVGVLARADVLRAVPTDVQSIQLERKAESVDLSFDYRLVVAFAPDLADACDAAPADVQSIEMEGKIQSPFAYPASTA